MWLHEKLKVWYKTIFRFSSESGYTRILEGYIYIRGMNLLRQWSWGPCESFREQPFSSRRRTSWCSNVSTHSRMRSFYGNGAGPRATWYWARCWLTTWESDGCWFSAASAKAPSSNIWDAAQAREMLESGCELEFLSWGYSPGLYRLFACCMTGSSSFCFYLLCTEIYWKLTWTGILHVNKL